MTKLSPIFKAINADVADYYATLPRPLGFETGAIFYDDPSALADEEQMRVSAGILVRCSTSSVEAFMKKRGYSKAELPKCQAITCSHPMRVTRLGL